MNKRCFLTVVTVLTLAVQTQAALLFDRASTWRWRPGTNEASSPVSGWRTVGFSDAEFTTAPAPFWYGDVLSGGTEITGMSSVYSCVFLRLPFVVTNLSEVAGLRLGALVDDGLVAWINGTEVLRVNMPDVAGTEVTITNLAVNATEPVAFTFYNLTNPPNYLVSGTNVIAVQVFQSSLTSSDLGFDASLEAILVETNPPTVLSVSPARGSTVSSLAEITVTFSEAVTGVEAFDLRLNGATAFGMTPISASTYVFTFPQPAYGTVQITWDTAHGIVDQALPPNPFDAAGSGATWQYQLVDTTAPLVATVTPAAGATVPSLTNLTVFFSEPVTGVDAADLRINGNPATGLVQSAPDLYTFSFTQPTNGLVQVAWNAGHGITDLAPAANAFAGGNWLYTLDPTAQTSLPYISEFMAWNAGTLADADGDFSDWIEIYNPAGLPVNLENWYLTDNAENLTKWRFPATNLAGGKFLLVWASEKNRRVPGAPLHANFRLSAGGDYLALVKPDGVTVVSEFKPTFPPQAADLSYGFGSLTTNQTVITSNTLVRVQVPPNGNDGLAWTLPSYDDSGWTLGTNGVGYGTTNATSADYSVIVQPTQPVGYWRLNESSGTTAANTGSGTGLNGAYSSVTVGTAGPRPPQFNGFEANNNAPTFNGSSSYVGVNSSLLNGRGAFTIAGWVRTAAAQAARTGLFGQNDCVEFGFIDSATLQCWTPGGGSVNATYSLGAGVWFHVVAVGDGSTIRIFINGALAASGGSPTTSYGTSGSSFNIGGNGIFDTAGNFFNGQLDEVVAYHRALSTAEITALYQGGLQPAVVAVTPYVRTDLGPVMSNVNASAYFRLPFTVEDPAIVALLTLKMRYDDGFVAFVNGLEVARANAPETLGFNSAATNTHSPASVQDFRIGGLALRSGTNILAIQGLNRAANDEDFLTALELTLTYVAANSTAPLYFSPATPGEENVGGVLFPGPSILNATHTPNMPLDNQDLLVTARVLPTFNAISGVVMRYRIMFTNEIEVAMFDDGLHGDGGANDAVFGATIPASASTNGQMIRWFIRATDALGNQSRWPLFAGAESAEYLGTIVDPTNVTSKLPIIHLFAPANILGVGPTTSQTGADSQAGARISLFYDGEFYDNVHMQLRGNTTAGYNKKSHRVEFTRDHLFRHAGAGYGTPDRPAPRISKTSFVADYPDPTYMRQGLAFWLCDIMGSPGSFYYPVRLQLNGQFYQLANHNDVHSADLLERLGYDPDGALYNAAGTVQPSRQSTGGFEKKTRKWDPDTDYAALSAGINETNSLATRATNFFENFDIPNALNYLVAARWSHENDDVWANMSLYHDNDGDNLWRLIGFDMNLSWGAIFYEGGTPSVIEGVQATNDIHKAHPFYGGTNALALSGPGSPNNFNRVYDTVFQVPGLREMYLRRVRTMMDTFVKPPGTAPSELVMENKILAWRNLIAEEAERDRNFWGWPGKGGQCNFDPGIRITNAVDAMINDFVVKRRLHFYVKHCITNTALPIGLTKADNAGIPVSQNPDAAIAVASVDFNPASSNQAQEFICVTNPNPYALDISGWKLDRGVQFTFQPGTVLPSNSVLYVAADARAFRARTAGPRGRQGLFIVGPYQGQLSARGETIEVQNERGAVVSAFAYPGNPSLAQQYLRITELMYNPAPLAGNTNSAQEFEYVELKNISTSVTLDLNGVKFANGIGFVFSGSAVTTLAPQQTVLVVKNPAAFAARYGAVASVAGAYTGSFDNGGERLQLLDAMNEEILDFSYDNRWYPITDGVGFSLVVVNEMAEADAWGSSTNWRASGVADGTPGAADPGVPTFAPVLVNELLSNPDGTIRSGQVVELFNPNTNAVDLSGWYLTDNFNLPKKFSFLPGTSIAGGGFLLVDDAEFNPSGLGFRFSPDGEEIYLFSASGGVLTGFYHGFNFGGAETNVTFGRYVDSEGDEQFVAQSAITLGAVNAGPLVSPVVINEIMYNPVELTTNDPPSSYVELLNISATNVPLYHVEQPTNTWRLRDAVDFNFPSSVTLPPSGTLLVVGFDPATNTTALAAFRNRYGVATNVPIYGPWRGVLANNEDTIELKRPGVAVGTNPAPYILVEQVHYHDTPPWPATADGLGAALARLRVAEFGNDPTNWVAPLPSPGVITGSGQAPAVTAQPQSAVVVSGSTVTFEATVTGDAPLVLQWTRNGAYLPGATSTSLVLPSVDRSQTGQYRLVALNPYGSALSEAATLAVPFVITNQPQSQAVFPYATVVFALGVAADPGVVFQWRFNGANIPDATNRALIKTGVLPADTGVYTVLVTNAGLSEISAPATLTVLTNPVILAQPQSQSALPASNVLFSVTAISSTPLRYQWHFNGANLPNATNSTLLITNTSASHVGTYDVLVTDSFGSVLSDPVQFTQRIKPGVAQHPLPRAVAAYVGDTVAYTVVVSNTATLPVGYRWRRNGSSVSTNLEFSFTNTLVLTNVQFTHAGAYDVAITNIAGNTLPATTARCFLTVMEVLADQAVPLGSNAKFSLVITNGGPSGGTNTLNYAWWFQGTNRLASGTNLTFTSLTISNVQASNFGPYTVVITNAAGISATQTAMLSLPQPPVIVGQPTNQTVSAGADASFAVTVTGSAPLGYRWWFNGTNAVPGGTGSVLTLSNAQPAQAGGYHVIVSNIVGSATSEVATLTVTLSEPPRFDGIIAATSPTEPVTMNFTAQPGQTYSVLYSDTVTATNWLVLTNIGPLGAAQPVTARDADVVGRPQRFYRIVTPAQP